MEKSIEEIYKDWPLSEMYSTELCSVLKTMILTSEELPTTVFSADHFLLAILYQKTNSVYHILSDLLTTSSLEKIQGIYYRYIQSKSLSAIRPNAKLKLDDTFKAYITNANDNRIQNHPLNPLLDQSLNCLHIFIEILSDKSSENNIKKVFAKEGITKSIFINKCLQKFDSANSSYVEKKREEGEDENSTEGGPTIKPIIRIKRVSEDNDSNVNKYCINLNKLAEEGKITKLVGRERETENIIRILGRKRTNNILIVGSEGVGKTALAENLAVMINEGNVPSFLEDKVVLLFDMTAVMAGTTLRGMFEERIKNLIDEIKKNGNYILVMDNISSIFSNNKNESFDMSGLMSRALESGDVQVIGTTNFGPYRTTFEKNPSLNRRFQKLIIDPPTIKESEVILEGIKEEFEKYHHVKYSEDVTKMCVKLAHKYISERNLPDSAIELLDEAGSYRGTMCDDEVIKELKSRIKSMEDSIAEIKKTTKDYKQVDKISEDINGLIHDLNDRKREYAKEQEANPIDITPEDILHIISSKTGIPVDELSSDDMQKLVTMNERLKKEVIGQDEQIDIICKGIKRNKVGLHGNGCMYSSLLIGKTGVGKSLIAKKLAKELFGDEDAMVRFDMSEYSEKSSVSKLIGSNAGYVGYEDGGLLTEAIKNKKHCILLLDEIEKADPDAYNIFLQILDEGRLTDNAGMKVDCKNIVVLFTSNVGAKAASDFGKGIGFVDDGTKSKSVMLKELKNKFPPEFLNRIDNILYFNSLKDEDLEKIISLELNKLNQRLSEIGYEMEYDDKVVKFILNIVKEEKEFGARPIRRAIQENIEDRITDCILNGREDKSLKITANDAIVVA